MVTIRVSLLKLSDQRTFSLHEYFNKHPQKDSMGLSKNVATLKEHFIVAALVICTFNSLILQLTILNAGRDGFLLLFPKSENTVPLGGLTAGLQPRGILVII